jgi:NMD protein affecting ribosome stability and mRNA decay
MNGNSQQPATQLHRHRAVVTHALRQQAGIPYEVERKICSDCQRILDERTVRRAAA